MSASEAQEPMEAVAKEWLAEEAKGEAKKEKTLQALEPKPAEEANPADVVLSAEELTQVAWGTVGLLLVKWKGEQAAFTDNEMKQLVRLWTPVASKYLPSNGGLPVEVVAILATVPILAPRLVMKNPEPANSDAPSEQPSARAA